MQTAEVDDNEDRDLPTRCPTCNVQFKGTDVAVQKAGKAFAYCSICREPSYFLAGGAFDDVGTYSARASLRAVYPVHRICPACSSPYARNIAEGHLRCVSGHDFFYGAVRTRHDIGPTPYQRQNLVNERQRLRDRIDDLERRVAQISADIILYGLGV